MFWPCETRTSTCRSFATISSGLYRFLAVAVLLDVKDIPQVGPLQWGWITGAIEHLASRLPANPENRYHPRHSGVHPGNSDTLWRCASWPGRGRTFRRFQHLFPLV